ncbi:GNAT family N-acetyltransferase [Nitrogeniibacter mangrovi]|uniref:GNAT family N-acetyltransferase n=1 Tax=Nitrogeniibacter mangrovi TaxID=2016596 RepID=A0A6C1B1N9_9RHOO|nr:GNAT family N-acetyltransferase [Nitrogeniibacter mangrovi]QID16184.1 GNAT family N-acetyltransferase [Nitrogeniibacter mangrovi]
MRPTPKELLKAGARLLLGEYAAYYIYRSPDRAHDALATTDDVRLLERSAVESCDDEVIRAQLPYLGDQALAYGGFADDRLAGICIYWYGDRYRTRNFWPLDTGEAKLVQIITTPAARGRGVATTLIAASHAQLLSKGFHQAYARVWHSNTPSLRAFERAGWTRIALVVEINPLRRKRPLRLRFRTRG